MLKNVVESETKIYIEHTLEFIRDDGSGFSFPCDSSGNVIDLPPEAVYNLAWCMEHPEEFKTYNKVVTRKFNYREPAHWTCICGEDVELYDQYYGACQCTNCGRWYNLFGQELIAPEYWEKDLYEEEYW